MLTARITERLGNVNFLASALVSGVVHGGITAALLHFRNRSQTEP